MENEKKCVQCGSKDNLIELQNGKNEQSQEFQAGKSSRWNN